MDRRACTSNISYYYYMLDTADHQRKPFSFRVAYLFILRLSEQKIFQTYIEVQNFSGEPLKKLHDFGNA